MQQEQRTDIQKQPATPNPAHDKRRTMHIKRSVFRGGLAALAALTAITVITGCTSATGSPSAAGNGTGTIKVWAHQGSDAEDAALTATVAQFNSSQSKIHANLTIIPAATYTSTITSTPTNKLPDVLEMDGPTLSSYVYNEKLAPLSKYVPAATISNATPGSITEGTSKGKLYGLAMYDSALGLFGNKKMLDAAGIKYPTSLSDVWTAAEFTADVKKLAAVSPTGKSLDIREAGLAGEWGTFAFSPLLWSAGGNLIKDNKASGVMDSAASVKALTTLASWKPYVDPSADGLAFPDGRVALAWGGHWLYPTYSAGVGVSNIVALPLPDFGNGTKTGAGSWTWGIGAGTTKGKAAGQFLATLLADKSVKAMTDADGAPPATKTAFAADKLYAPGGALALWADQLKENCGTGPLNKSCVSVDRPQTAGYPVITSQFSAALSAIWGGADPKTALTTAAQTIDQAFSDNSNYK
jgi:multiple sugar transport system substrate-binding protein